MQRVRIITLLVFLSLSGFAQDSGQHLQDSFNDYLELKKSTTLGLQWISAGPVLNSARAEAVQAHPQEPGTIYTAFGSGGLWKSTNNGLSWQAIFENKPSLGIGDFALAPADPKVIYLGTGESLRKARNFTMPGDGLYKSIDGGENWQHLGLVNAGHIGEIAIHPTNPDIVVVAVLGDFWSVSPARGIYRTEDGGKSWQHVLYIDEKTGGNDVKFSIADPNYVYATTWSFKAGTHGDKNYNNTGSGSGVYISKDGGKTWEKGKSGLPSGEKIGRSGVAVSHQNPDKAYWFVDNQNNPERETAEVYKTQDGGKNWKKTNRKSLKLLSVVNWYFMDSYVSPDNDDELYILGVRVARSTDGGETFEFVAGDVTHINPSVAQGLHLDHCELWINPENSSHLILANDGGLYSSHDKGVSWLHHNNIPTGEFYDITLEKGESYNIYGGVQDDATVFGPAKEWNSLYPDPWQYLWIDPWNGGDGCVTQLDPIDTNIVYYSSQNGGARRLDRNTGKSKGIRPRVSDTTKTIEFNFITPYFISHFDNKTLYSGGNYVFKTVDRGDSWEIISPDLAKSGKKNRSSVAAGALVESTIAKGTLYWGSDRGRFWTTRNDGENWTEYSKGLPEAYIRSIYPSKHKEGRVYVALTGVNYDDLNAYLYVSEDHGKKWSLLSSNLPNEPMNVIIEDPTNENILYVGGYRGVYISVNRGESWSLFGNMPATSVADLEINEEAGDIVAATHGRGIYYLNLEPVHAIESLDKENLKLLYAPTIEAPHRTVPGAYIDQGAIDKLPITFWLPEASDYTLEIAGEGEVIWNLTSPGMKGLNQVHWDMITKKEDSDLPYFIRYNEYVQSGEYQLILKAGGESDEITLTLN